MLIKARYWNHCHHWLMCIIFTCPIIKLMSLTLPDKGMMDNKKIIIKKNKNNKISCNYCNWFYYIFNTTEIPYLCTPMYYLLCIKCILLCRIYFDHREQLHVYQLSDQSKKLWRKVFHKPWVSVNCLSHSFSLLVAMCVSYKFLIFFTKPSWSFEFWQGEEKLKVPILFVSLSLIVKTLKSWSGNLNV